MPRSAPSASRETISRDSLRQLGGEGRVGTCGGGWLSLGSPRAPPVRSLPGPSDPAHVREAGGGGAGVGVWGERALRQRVQKTGSGAGASCGWGLGNLSASLPVLQGKCCHIGEIPNHFISLGCLSGWFCQKPSSAFIVPFPASPTVSPGPFPTHAHPNPILLREKLGFVFYARLQGEKSSSLSVAPPPDPGLLSTGLRVVSLPSRNAIYN